MEALGKALRDWTTSKGETSGWKSGGQTATRPGCSGLARALVELNVDVICTARTAATLAAKQATATIPMVFGRAAMRNTQVSSRVSAGPGGNLTGVTFVGQIRQAAGAPWRGLAEISQVVCSTTDQNTASVLAMKETQEWAKTLQVAVEHWACTTARAWRRPSPPCAADGLMLS